MTWLERLLIMLWVCIAILWMPAVVRSVAEFEANRGITLPTRRRIAGGIASWVVLVGGAGLVLLGIRWVVLG